MTDVHSCSYYCDRPECIKAQRDELRERLVSMTDREIMQQALEALQAVRDTPASADEIQRAWIVSDLLQRRLAQPEQDAVLAQREACAALVDANAMGCDNPIYRSLLQANAAAIRAMEKT